MCRCKMKLAPTVCLLWNYGEQQKENTAAWSNAHIQYIHTEWEWRENHKHTSSHVAEYSGTRNTQWEPCTVSSYIWSLYKKSLVLLWFSAHTIRISGGWLIPLTSVMIHLVTVHNKPIHTHWTFPHFITLQPQTSIGSFKILCYRPTKSNA